MMVRLQRSVCIVSAVALGACSLFADLGGLAGTAPRDGGSDPVDAPVGSASDAADVVFVPDAQRDAACAPEATSIDAKNCGVCGHSCLGGACNSGVCQPFVMAAEVTPFGIASDGTSLYWAGRAAGAIRAKNLTNGAMRDVATGLGSDLHYLTIRGPLLYFVDRQASRIASVPTAGGSPAMSVVTGLSVPAGLAWSEGLGRLIWTERGPIGLKSARPDGTGVAAFPALVTDPEGVAADGNDVFIADELGNALLRVRAGVTSTILGLNDVVGVALDSNYYYCTQQDLGLVVRIPRTGTPVAETLASGQAFPSGIVSTTDAIYWTNPKGNAVMGLAK